MILNPLILAPDERASIEKDSNKNCPLVHESFQPCVLTDVN